MTNLVNYSRVIPRDLFNEAKLLKGLGRLVILIGEGKAGDLNVAMGLRAAGFCVMQDPTSSDLRAYNVHFFVGQHLASREVRLYSSYNSQAPYPLYAEWENEEVCVFEDDGELTNDFLELLQRIGSHAQTEEEA